MERARPRVWAGSAGMRECGITRVVEYDSAETRRGHITRNVRVTDLILSRRENPATREQARRLLRKFSSRQDRDLSFVRRSDRRDIFRDDEILAAYAWRYIKYITAVFTIFRVIIESTARTPKKRNATYFHRALNSRHDQFFILPTDSYAAHILCKQINRISRSMI